MSTSKYRILKKVFPRPSADEESAAELVSEFLRADVEFLQAGQSKTPDLLIANQRWEIKNPTGSKTQTILHQFQRASKQAQFLIFDARRIKMSPARCLARVKYYFGKSKTIKRVIYIDRNGRVRELEK